MPKWLLLTRLETRTKESIQYASVREEKPERATKVSKRYDPQGAVSTDLDPTGKGSSKSIFDRTRKMVNYA